MIFYSEYQALFGDLAIIPESGFDLWVKKSIAEIDRFINVPVSEIETDNARLCILEVTECIYQSSQNSGIRSENTDGYSVTYYDRKSDVYGIIKKYLGEYLYRGVDL